MSSDESFPRQSARTRRFTLGEPRTVTVCRDGTRVLFLRSRSGSDPLTALWCLDVGEGGERLVADPQQADADLPAAERARRERARETAGGVVAYSADRAGSTVVFALGGMLHAADVDAATSRVVVAGRDVFDPRIDPTGSRVAYVSGGSLWCRDLHGDDERCLAEGGGDVSWGRAEHVAAEEMNRLRGFWWNPDGTSLLVTEVDDTPVRTWWTADPAHPDRAPVAMRFPAAGTPNARVALHHVRLDGSAVRVDWDADAYPYLARVTWNAGGPPLLQVQSRDQRRVRTLSLDVATGATTVLAEDTDDIWVELFDGVPDWFADRLVRIADVDGARRLLVGDEAVTPADVYVRHVVDVGDDAVVLTASFDDPTQVHVAQWTPAGLQRLTSEAGVHAAVAADGTVVVSSAALGWSGQRHHVVRRDARHELSSVAEEPVLQPQPRLVRLGDRALPAGIVLPRAHVRGEKLPVLMDPYGGPHAQRVLSARRVWLEPQWWADQGFAVVVADGRGTPGRDPAWEREVHHDLASTLTDQVDALRAAAELEPDLDLARVAIRGWSFGGYLAALAVLRRPDVFHAAVAGAPVTDWRLYDTHYTERYLGDPAAQPEVYARNSLLDDAAALERPLLVIHGLADDNVVAAHSLLLSQRLTEAGRQHGFLPLSGVTHMTPQEEVAENLLLLQLQFLRAALSA
jgi:dipeptidyl-peptidase-4